MSSDPRPSHCRAPRCRGWRSQGRQSAARPADPAVTGSTLPCLAARASRPTRTSRMSPGRMLVRSADAAASRSAGCTCSPGSSHGRSLRCRQVKQHATADDAGRECLDRASRRAARRCHQVRRAVRCTWQRRRTGARTRRVRHREAVRCQPEPVAGVAPAPGRSGLAGCLHELQRRQRVVRLRVSADPAAEGNAGTALHQRGRRDAALRR